MRVVSRIPITRYSKGNKVTQLMEHIQQWHNIKYTKALKFQMYTDSILVKHLSENKPSETFGL